MTMSGAGKKRKTKEVLKKVNTFLKKHKLISKGAKVLVKVAPKKHRGKIKAAGDVAGLLGYGVSLPGGGLKLAGQGLKLAGQGKKRKGKKPGPKKKRKAKK